MLTQTRPPTTGPHGECSIDILSFQAHIVGPVGVARLAQHLFPPSPAWSTATIPTTQLAIQVEHIDDGSGWRVVENGIEQNTVAGLPELASVLAWIINSRAVESLGNDHLLFHAGAVALGQTGIILPGRSGSGKSTLTAALIAQGCTYFSDEVAVIAAQGGCLLPFAKAIKLEPDSVPILAGHYPELAHANDQPGHDDSRATYLRPPEAAWPPAPVSPTFVVFPRYEAGARTRLDAIPRAEGFARLLALSFNATHHAAVGVQQIVQLLRGCASYDLIFGDLDDAVTELLLLTAGLPESGSTSSSQASHRRFTRADYRLNTECSHRQTS